MNHRQTRRHHLGTVEERSAPDLREGSASPPVPLIRTITEAPIQLDRSALGVGAHARMRLLVRRTDGCTPDLASFEARKLARKRGEKRASSSEWMI